MSRARGRLADLALELQRAGGLLWTVARFASPLLVRKLMRRPGDGGQAAAVAIRMGMERLGVTYLKLGQYLAMRFDILPPVVCRELARLFDNVAPMTYEQAREVIESSLGRPIDELYARFESKPLAAASVAQVHEAWTYDGERVAVKVQRPGLKRIFAADMRNVSRLTRLVDAFHLLGRLSATEMLEQFATWTFRETDFELEGRTAERVGSNASEFEYEPHVRWDLSRAGVLTLEFIEGVTLSEVVRLVEEGGLARLAEVHPQIDVDVVLHHLTLASLRQIFVTGLFHGDAHPGNVFVLEHNHVAFVDFGIFGELTPFDRELLGQQIDALSVGNIDASLRAYSKQLAITEESDVQAFRDEARAVLRTWYEVSLRGEASVADRHLGGYTMQMIDISRRYKLLYDMSFLLYWRALNALDSTALRLSPTFDLMNELRTFFAEIRPDARERLRHALTDTNNLAMVRELGTEGPRRAAALVRDGAAGRFDGLLAVAEGRGSRRGRDREAAWIGAALVAVSLTLLAGSTAALVVSVPAAAGALVLGALSVARLRL